MKLFLAALLLTSCHPLRMDWSGAVDMNKGRELYEAQRIQQVMENDSSAPTT